MFIVHIFLYLDAKLLTRVMVNFSAHNMQINLLPNKVYSQHFRFFLQLQTTDCGEAYGCSLILDICI